MELTPEERQRIYEEEKAHIDARTQISADAQVQYYRNNPSAARSAIRTYQLMQGCIGIFLTGIVLCIGGCFYLSSHPASNHTTETTAKKYLTDLGAEGHLVGAELEKVGTNQFVLLGTTQDAFEAFSKANVAKDSTGIEELVRAGSIYSVPSGQVCAKKIDANWTGIVQVRLLSGEHSGASAWTYYGMLAKVVQAR